MLENIYNEYLNIIIICYLIYSLGGFYFMNSYIRGCKEYNSDPFNNSALKGFFMLVICGLFTQIILFYGIVSSIFDFFRKKD